MARLHLHNCKLKLARSERGAALLLAIFTTLVLTVLAVGLAQVARVEVIASRANWYRLQASSIAKAGFNLGRAILMYQDDPDTLKTQEDPNAYMDTLQDTWATLHDEAPVELNGGWCKIKVVDACAMINVNQADLAILTSLLNDPNLAQAVVDYRAQNGKFHSLGELLSVDGITQEKLAELVNLLTVISLERNVSAAGQKRINLNVVNPSDVAGQLGLSLQQAQVIYSYRQSHGGSISSLGEIVRLFDKPVAKQLIDKVTLTDSEYLPGRVNLNTAPSEVLLALPGLSSEVAEAIITQRQEKDGAFKAPGNLLDLPGLSQEDFAALAPYICTKSSSFVIEAWAGLGDRPIRRALQAMVLRQPGPVAPIIYGWKEAAQPTFISPEEMDK